MQDIIVEEITKIYDGRPVLRSFSHVFPAGSITCVTGPSGCGKTTLLRMIAGLTEPDCGRILGTSSMTAAVVFQEDRLCEAFTAERNIKLSCGKSSAEHIRRILKELDLDRAEGPVANYSGGMKRRVSLARALCFDADYLLLDEPFAGLDPEHKRAAMDCILAARRNRTMICVTHDREDAEYMGAAIADLSAAPDDAPPRAGQADRAGL